ncbi:hypothetical protein D3C83_144740 [compost metagenome]
MRRIEVEAREAPALGGAARPQARDGGGPVERLPAGRFLVRVRWAPEGDAAGDARLHEEEVAVEAGATALVRVRR